MTSFWNIEKVLISGSDWIKSNRYISIMSFLNKQFFVSEWWRSNLKHIKPCYIFNWKQKCDPNPFWIWEKNSYISFFWVKYSRIYNKQNCSKCHFNVIWSNCLHQYFRYCRENEQANKNDENSIKTIFLSIQIVKE